MSRSITIKLTNETLCYLLKEVLDLPQDVEIVAMRGSPIADETMLTLESPRQGILNSIPEGIANGWIDFVIHKIKQKGRIGRTFLRFRDAADLTRAMASVPDAVPLFGAKLEQAEAKDGLHIERKVAPPGPER